MSRAFLFFGSFLLGIGSVVAQDITRDFCQLVFQPQLAADQTIFRAMLKTPSRQLKQWEQKSNTARWEKPSEELNLDYVLVNQDDVVLRLNDSSGSIQKTLVTEEGKVKWFKHPNNSDQSVPHYYDEVDGSIIGQYSASRSMFVDDLPDEGFFSFKLPTNRPHPSAKAQPNKANLGNDSIISMRRSELIKAIDEVAPPNERLMVLTEVASVSAKGGRSNGFSIRDLRPLKDGNYYLPAFSIPYVGRNIARWNRANFDEFWGRFYARNLGEAKAYLLLRYGLQMKTPNAQNWLIQLDENFRPTGRIVMRDVADSSHLDSFSSHGLAKKYMDQDKQDGFNIARELEPYYENSVWQMDEGGISSTILDQWGEIHDQAFFNVMKRELGLSKEDGIQLMDFQLLILTNKADVVEKVRLYQSRLLD